MSTEYQVRLYGLTFATRQTWAEARDIRTETRARAAEPEKVTITKCEPIGEFPWFRWTEMRG